MNNWLKNYIFPTKSINRFKNLKKVKAYFKSPCFWSSERECIARGVAAGLAGAVIPGFQILYAAILVIILRGNLPIALLFTLITNPLTVVPITYFVYFVGTLIIKNGKTDFVIQNFHWDFSSFHAFWFNVTTWVLQFGKAFLMGLPIVSLTLGILGYFGTILLWRVHHRLFQQKK